MPESDDENVYASATDTLRQLLGAEGRRIPRNQPHALVIVAHQRWSEAERGLATVRSLLGLPPDADVEAIIRAIPARQAAPPPQEEGGSANGGFDPRAEGEKIGQQIVAGLSKLVQNLTENPRPPRQ